MCPDPTGAGGDGGADRGGDRGRPDRLPRPSRGDRRAGDDSTGAHRGGRPARRDYRPDRRRGLVSGTAVAVRHVSPKTRVIGCEPAGADDAYRGIREGRRITDFTPHTIADGLRTTIGALNFEVIRAAVDEIVRVADADIISAMRLIWARMKIIIEPSSAIGLAPLITGALDLTGKRVGIILTGVMSTSSGSSPDWRRWMRDKDMGEAGLEPATFRM